MVLVVAQERGKMCDCMVEQFLVQVFRREHLFPAKEEENFLAEMLFQAMKD